MKNLSVFLKYILDISLDIVMADSGLLLLTGKGDEDVIISVINNKVKSFSQQERVKLGETVCRWIIQQHTDAFLLKDTDIRSWQFNHIKGSRKVKSIICIPLKIKGKISDALVLVRSIDKDNFDTNDLEWAKLLGYEYEIIIENLTAENISEYNWREIITALVVMIELKDPITKGHSERVKKIATFIARKMGLSEEEIELINRAAILHDIGKLRINNNILKKAGPLNDKEWEEIKKHPLIGTDILKPLNGLRDTLPIICHHHEHYNGEGYPAKLKGEDIPLAARILSVADAVEVMSSTRPYRRVLTKQQILREIKNGQGKQFDPQIASYVLRLISDGELDLSKTIERKIILMIDDNKDFCRLVKMNLEMLDNYHVISANEGKRGIKMAERTKPDLILLDLVMPGMDGFEILRILKKNKKTADIPVIMLTVKGDEDSKLKAMRLYSDDYLTKPVGVDMLRARIKKSLSKKEKDSVGEKTLLEK